MTVGTMRMIDRFIGIPLCLLAGAFTRMRSFRHAPHQNPKVILVIKFFGLGSILLSASFLEALHRIHPDVKLIYLTFRANQELLEKLPQVSRRLTISTSSISGFLRDTFAAMTFLRKNAVDIVFDLEFFSKFSTLLSTASGAPVRVGYDLPTLWRKWNLTHPLPLDHSSHVASVFMRQLEALGEVPDNPTAGFRLAASHVERASMQQKLSIGSNGIENIAININAGPASLERRWPREKFMDVIGELHAAKPGRRFFLIGNTDESEYVAEALRPSAHGSAHVVNCAGMLTIGELIALCEQCSILLTNDSGPMHIAASVGTPVVALFGPESPQFYGPKGVARIVYKAIECSPCLSMYNAKLFECPYNARCMREITVAEVLEAVNEILATASSGIRR